MCSVEWYLCAGVRKVKWVMRQKKKPECRVLRGTKVERQ